MEFAKKRRQNPVDRALRYLAQSRRWVKVLGGAIAAFVLFSLVSVPSEGRAPHAIVTSGYRGGRAAQKRLVKDGLGDFVKDNICHFSSQDIHHPQTTLCPDRQSLLRAMSGGGRLGWDMPYWTRDCDMQWFTTAEICQILGRFDEIHIIGDSFMRHLSMAIMVLLRGDLSTGARATWLDQPSDEPDRCRCRDLFVNHRCMPKASIHTTQILKGDPSVIKCPAGTPIAQVTWDSMLGFPVDEKSFDWIKDVKNKYPNGRTVFVLEHGLWDDFTISTMMNTFETFEAKFEEYLPAYADRSVNSSLVPRLYITPQAQGERKQDQFLGTQNNLRLQKLTHAMGPYVSERGWDHLGFFNLTLQATSTDGTHASVENNLMKAMMVLNWLNFLE